MLYTGKNWPLPFVIMDIKKLNSSNSSRCVINKGFEATIVVNNLSKNSRHKNNY